MIISEHEQGSDEWLYERSIIPTASEFSNILTPTGKPSTSADRYLNELLASWYTGLVQEAYISAWMTRGNELEAEAAALYGVLRDVEPASAGLCYKDAKKLVGMSPDRLIRENGILEIKCPKPSTHIGYLLRGVLPEKYVPQIQGQLWVSGREWCDFMSYSPDFAEPMIVRVWRDEDYIKKLSDQLDKFIEKMLLFRYKLDPVKASCAPTPANPSRTIPAG